MCKDIILSVINILFNFAQLLSGVWCNNCNYFLYLRNCVFGRSETVVLRHAEGSPCSWTSSACWLRRQNSEPWRRGNHWYRDVSRGNASTAWKTIGILCKISFFPFLVPCELQLTYIQISFGTIIWPTVPEYIDELIEVLIEKKAPFVRGNCSL